MSSRLIRILLLSFLLTALLSPGCSDERNLFTHEDVNLLTVDAILYVGQNPPVIFLSRTVTPEGPWSFEKSSESGATITIESDYGTMLYRASRQYPGMHVPVPPFHIILPQTNYRLTVVTADGERLTAETTTPARINITDWVLLDANTGQVERELATFNDPIPSVYDAPQNQLVYSVGLLEARLNPQTTAGYQAGIYSMDPWTDLVIDPEFLDEEDLDDFSRNVASPPILASETNIRLPWFAIYYEGRYKIRIYSLDRNWYDLARSSPYFSGGDGGFGGNAGDGFERPIYHINGGIGIFGSASVDSIGFRVLARP